MKTYQLTTKRDHLVLNSKTKVYIPVNFIVMLKGQANYTTFILSDGRERVVARTLKFFEPFLASHGFQRIHRASMINPKFIKKYDIVTSLITMKNEMAVKISRRRKDSFQFIKT